MAHTWTMGGCIVYTGIMLLLLTCPFISSFFFLSNFQIQCIKIFVTFFSEAMKPRKLKLNTNMNSGLMHRV